MGVKNVVKKIGQGAGNKVAKLSALSPTQIEEIQLKREQYLLEMPDPTDETARALTEKMMAANSIEIFNSFLPQIKDLYIPVEEDAEYACAFDPDHNIRYFNITKWVTDKKENNLEKLVNVYAVLSNEDCNIALVFNRTKHETNVYLAVVDTQNSSSSVLSEAYKNRLIEAIRGNFPGAEWANEGLGVLPCLDNTNPYSVATASNIPTEKSEKFISQTIEKLLDGTIPAGTHDEYTIILLATPIQDIEERKLKLGEIYSGMAPYASWQTDYRYSENDTVGSSATVGVNVGASAGIQNGNNYGTTETDSTTDNSSTTNTTSESDTNSSGTSTTNSESQAQSSGTSEVDTTSTGTATQSGTSSSNTSSSSQNEGTSNSTSANASVKIAGVSTSEEITEGKQWGTAVTEAVSNSTSVTESAAKALGRTAMDTLTRGVSNTVSNTVAKTTGTAVATTLGKAVTKGMAVTSGISKSVNAGVNAGANFARSSTVSTMLGKNEGITQTFTNYNVKHALELLENQMKRLEQSTALGMWDFAAYVVCENPDIANNVAHSYLALTLGEDSYMSKSAINMWKGKVEGEKEMAQTICGYLRNLRHPIFGLNPAIVEADEEFNEYPPLVTATTSLSGKELAFSLNFPQRSIAGLPILECAEFYRNVVTYDSTNLESEKIVLGNVFHMHHEENTPVELSNKSLASHTFITGSTGSGKSNTVYHMLKQAKKQGVKFLVVEPAKGEYKNVFGNHKDVSVYGTNPKLTPILRINPFSFNDSIHVLEHMDRLVEIFNVCWPMYAAMPAVLKNAVEKSYVNCGWDLVKSENKYGEDIYPTFADIAKNIKDIIDDSEYDDENKGAYKGSLLTRLESLTNGINGMIFSSDELSENELFDENVIVDLSRVGSNETKSLIMGMLVLKLQEYRMSSDGMNAELKHLTVLEEAHNLLRRTSIEQTSDSANLLGKSVEMLANAIAEMRTYGEGFIIADQAPGLMDMSVIRNTNTKIIMRLPDQSDRELVGRAANLNDEQILELAKLPCGVAAVYQNEWLQPVLCKIKKCSKDYAKFIFDPSEFEMLCKKEDDISDSLLKCIMDKELFGSGNKADIRKLKTAVIKSKLESDVKVDLLEYIAANDENGIEVLRGLIYDFLSAEDAIKASQKCDNINDWIHTVVNNLKPSINDFSKKQIDLAMALMLYEQVERDSAYSDVFCRFSEVYKANGGVY